jgi:hypothetical protein
VSVIDPQKTTKLQVKSRFSPRAVSPVNRRLSLCKFEPCTCHHQRKRPLACSYRGLRAVCSLCRLVASGAVAGFRVAVVADI